MLLSSSIVKIVSVLRFASNDESDQYAVALLGVMLASAPAFAGGRYHGGHEGARVGVGVYVGPGWWGPGYGY